MPLQIPPASDVVLLLFAAWTAGTTVGGAVTRLWRVVDPGHFKVIWLVCAGLGGVAGIGYRPAWILTGLALVTFAAIYRGRDLEAGLVGAAAAVAVLVGASLGAEGGDAPLVGFTAATALLMGAATNAMLLGHWHLNQPRLGTDSLKRLVVGLWGGIGAYLLASVLVLVTGLRGAEDSAVVGAVTAIAFTVFTGILTAMVTHLVRIRSIMSATGILYLELLLVFVAAFTGTLGALALA